MEGSESEAVFNAHDLNPQRFLNEVLNSTDDLIHDAFNFFLQQASDIASASAGTGSDRSDDLARGVSSLQHLIQAVVDKRMGMWENYCIRHCFTVPEGISLPKTQNSSCEALFPQEELSDAELDSQLDYLRNKLAVVGKESAELLREQQQLEKESTISHNSDLLVTEALQFFEQNSLHQMFQEMGETTSKLLLKMDEVKIRRRDVKRTSVEKTTIIDTGLSARMEDIQKVVNILKRA